MTDVLSELDREAATDKETPVMGKKAKVTVTAMPLSAAPWVDFAMRSRYPNQGGEQKGDELKFDENAGPFEIIFKLEDETDLDLEFFPDFADAIWVAVGSNCPKVPGDGDGAITPVDVDDDKLVVMNANAAGQVLTFALRFTGKASDGGYPPYVFDPKIVNGGDGGGLAEDDGDDDRSDDDGD